MLGRFTAAGWEVVDRPQGANVLLVNTCAFIESACREAVDSILELARHKEQDPEVRLLVAGCLVQRYGAELLRDLPEVDLFVGVNDFPRLPGLLTAVASNGLSRLHCQAPPYPFAGLEPRYPATPPHLAYLKIAEGCSHRCTFCVIPRIRGPYRSRPLPVLVAEARRLAAQGVRELILVAQDTTSYGQDWGGPPGLVELLEELARIPELTWIRLLYGHPARVTDELLAAMAASPKICPYLDLPIQHGHPEMLRRMGRSYTPELVRQLARKVREQLPGATLRTTVMVGFPGETEEHFAALTELVREVRFEHLGIFLYSSENGTPAAGFAPKVPRRVARRRVRLLKEMQAGIVKKRLRALVGTVQPVLVEGVSRESDYLLSGRLMSQAPDIDGQVYLTAGEGRVGEIQPVRVTRALPFDLLGEIVAEVETAKR